jgi:hypothetical protein
MTTSGIGGFVYDGAYKLARVACGLGAWHLAMVRWDGTNIGVTLDSGSETTTAAGTATVMTGTLVNGLGYPNPTSKYFAGSILELATAAYTFSTSDYANFKSYVNARYGLSL